MIPAALKTRVAGAAIGGSMAIAMPFVAYFEGRNLFPYLDPVRIPTVCYGHTANVEMGRYYSPEECEELLRGDLKIAFDAVERHVAIPLAEETRAALASFVFNVGEGNFKSSTLLRLLNAGDVEAACHQLPRWIYAKGRKLRGLVIRRNAEMEICLKGVLNDEP